MGTVIWIVPIFFWKNNSDIGITTGTVNPIVCECNDGYLNDIRNFAVSKDMVSKAIKNWKIDFLQGDIGAGRGMSCYELKGGIGSASRTIPISGRNYKHSGAKWKLYQWFFWSDRGYCWRINY